MRLRVKALTFEMRCQTRSASFSCFDLHATYPMYHKVQDVVGRLREGVPTVASVLKGAGYSTAGFVGATVLSSRWNLNRGFDTYDDNFNIQEGLRQIDFDRMERSADEVVERAQTWLAGVGKRRSFSVCSLRSA